MVTRPEYDAVVVGSGPNGLAAAVTIARSGASVLVLEANDTIGGGTRSAELTLPGFVHDVCSAIHPLAVASPFFRSLPLGGHGLAFVHPDIPAAHPFDDGTAAVLVGSVDDTAGLLGGDGSSYRRLMGPFVRSAPRLSTELFGPVGTHELGGVMVLRPPRHPLTLLRFAARGLRSATGLTKSRFRTEAARALFGGMAGHAMLPLDASPTAAFGILLMWLAHTDGWPAARGGSQKIADALVSYLESCGGRVETGRRVTTLREVPPARAILLDVSARALATIAADRLPARYQARLRRWRHGPGVFKLDWALDGPIPWTAEQCRSAGTVHLGGPFAELAAAEAAVAGGRHPERPFVILAQQSLFDAARAPDGKHTAWAYCHVPSGSTVDMTERVELQIERFAPGFKDLVLERSVMAPGDLEDRNANLVGGDISGGVQDLRQLFFRPVPRLVPYATPAPGLYICSSSTPPGGGVHGMCGYWAARAALRRSL
ncbi:MAG: phytoene desaturase family protein [Actinomycetota bacterium]